MLKDCPKCTKYINEIIIHNYLNYLGISYIFQKSFKGCINKNLLRFDFYLPDYNLCIEYDGEGHYLPIKFSKKMTEDMVIDSFKNRQLCDQIKNDFCKNNNIPLLRIPYWDKENIEQIITNKLTELSLQKAL